MAELSGLGQAAFWMIFAGLVLGAAVQRLAGQGFGLISAPIVAIFAPEMVPSGLLLLGLLSGFGATALDLSAVKRDELPFGFAGRALGAAAAVWIITILPGRDTVSIAVAMIVLLAVMLSLLGLTIPIRRGTLFGAGLAAGIMGTLTAIGAPPMAMLYQREAPRRSRAMQSTFFLFGMVVSIAALIWAGLIGAAQVWFAVAAAPAIVAGTVLAQPMARFVGQAMVRPMALGFSTVAALILLVKTVLS